MIEIDKKKLEQYVYNKIDNINNPQSFKYQLETQLSVLLKKKEHQLKMNHIKLKNQKRFQEEIKKREALQSKVSAKLQKSVKNRQNKLQERVQSMMNLRQRKQQFVFERQKISRKAQLQKSLQKIKKLQEDKKIRSQNKLKVENISKSSTFDYLNKKNQADQEEYDYLVQRLQSKGIFKASNSSIPQQINELYRKKIKESRYQEEKREEETINKFGQKLSKIQQARKKKQRFMLQKTQKLKDIDKLQNQLKDNRLQQLEKIKRKKLKQLEMKNAVIIANKTSTKIEQSHLKHYEERHQNQYQSLQPQKYTIKPKNVNYKNQIRKHLDQFMKKNGY